MFGKILYTHNIVVYKRESNMGPMFRWISHAALTTFHFFRPQTTASVNPSSYDALNSVEIELDLSMENEPQEASPIPQTQAVIPETISVFQIAKSLCALVLSKENIPRIACATMLTGVSTALNFLAPYLFGETIRLLSSEDETTTIGGVELSRSALMTLLVTSYALSQVVPNLRDQIMVPVTLRNTKKVISLSTKHLLEKSLNYHVNTPFPDQVYFIQKGFAVSSIGTPLLTQIAPTVAEIAIACSVLSSRYGVEMGAGLFGLMASYTGYSALTAKPIINARETSLKAGNEAYENFCSAITQYKTMRDFGKFDETMKGVDAALNNMVDADITATIKPLQMGLGHYAISRASMLAATLYVGLGVQSGKFSVQEFVVLVGYLHQLSNLLPAFGQAINQLFASYPDLKFVFSELSKPDEVVDLHPETRLSVELGVAPSIEFDDVTFSYPSKPGEDEKPPLFKNLSFKVQSGQTVAFVSESGAGKTTIFNLLYGYYTPTQGTIKINDQDISQVSLNDLQKNIGLLGQTPNLFKGSIRDNIFYGAENPDQVTDPMIWDLARSANLFDFLQSFPEQLDTDVGEGGKKLSGGQQQKVAILRGLLKQSSIRLLDEITAPFDNQSAAQVLQSINKLSDGVTSLMITHKLKEAQYADQIIVIDNGKVIAQDIHDELLMTCDLYQKLWHADSKQESPRVESPLSSVKMLKALGGPSPSKREVDDAPSVIPAVKNSKIEESSDQEEHEDNSNSSVNMNQARR